MTTPWDLDFAARALHAGEELYIGEWTCDGAWRPPSAEVIRHVELGLQRDGAHIRTVGRQRRVVDPTTATINAIGDEVIMSPRAPQRATALLFRGALARELAPLLARRFTHVSAEAARLHLRLLRTADPVASQEAAFSLVDQITVDSGTRPEILDSSGPRWVLAEDIKHVIATRFAERLTLETIAVACGCSPFYASRVFRAVTGETIHRHLTRVRLRVALFKLEESAGRLTELALAVGFSSHSHFTRAFRSEFGCAPSVSS